MNARSKADDAKQTTQTIQSTHNKQNKRSKTNNAQHTNKTQFHIAMQHGTIQHDSTQRAMIYCNIM